MLPHHLFFYWHAHTQQHAPISHSISQLLSHTIKAACPIIGSPPSTFFPFCVGEGGFALSRRATADNKSKWQAHSQRPPHTKESCLMNHRHWQPNPHLTHAYTHTLLNGSSLHTSQMPMPDQYPSPICNSLLAGYLRQSCLQSGYQYQRHAGVCTAAREIDGDLQPRANAYWRNGTVTSPPLEVKVNQDSQRSGPTAARRCPLFASRWLCVRGSNWKVTANGEARSLPTAHFKCHW